MASPSLRLLRMVQTKWQGLHSLTSLVSQLGVGEIPPTVLLLIKVIYLYYGGTLQARAMALMGKKMEAAQALEGKFSAEGLASMAGEEGSAEMALAKSLADRIEEGDAARHWAKVGAAVSNAMRDIEFDDDIP